MLTFSFPNPSVIPDIDSNYGEKITNFKVSKNGEAYRNRQILNGGLAKTDTLVQSFAGDNENQTFTLDFIIKVITGITLNGSPVSFSEQIEGLDTDFVYKFKQKQATQRFTDTPLAPTDTLEITYIGFFAIRSVQEDAGEIAARAVITSSSGLVSYAATDKSVEDIDTSILKTVALLRKYLQENISVKFRIYENSSYDIFSIEQGQQFLINNTKWQITNETMLIEEVNLVLINNNFSYVDIKALDLISVNSVVNQFLQINKDATKIELNEDVIIIQTINSEDIVEVIDEYEVIVANALITGMDQAICGVQNTAIYTLGEEV